MQHSKFWRTVALVLCVGIFYVGHGLHNPGSEGTASLVNSARASGVTVDAIASGVGRVATRLYTVNESGTILYVWDAPSGRDGMPKHIATVGVPRDNWLPPIPK
ncbi:MAG TPA: hypothetical protein VEI07_09255 [Planctomycetaceae bacterium]|nr:hypothetical protein [Planctomycetaceae bacterium]